MNFKKIIDIKEAFSYVYIYDKLWFYLTIFVSCLTFFFIVEKIFLSILNILFNNIFIIKLTDFTFVPIIYILLSLLITLIMYFHEEKNIKKFNKIKIKYLKKFDVKKNKEQVFSNTVLFLIKDLELKNKINLNREKGFSNISKKQFKRLLKKNFSKNKNSFKGKEE